MLLPAGERLEADMVDSCAQGAIATDGCVVSCAVKSRLYRRSNGRAPSCAASGSLMCCSNGGVSFQSSFSLRCSSAFDFSYTGDRSEDEIAMVVSLVQLQDIEASSYCSLEAPKVAAVG